MRIYKAANRKCGRIVRLSDYIVRRGLWTGESESWIADSAKGCKRDGIASVHYLL